MRLIDADALKEVICDNVYPVTDYFNSRDYGMFWTGGIEKAINEAPTIDAEPIKHGRWIWSEDAPLEEGQIEGDREAWYKCSECDAYDLRLKDCHANYCWSCGARMEW